MRPKIVILTLVAAFAALGLIALLKGMSQKNGAVNGTQAQQAQATANSNPAVTNDQPVLPNYSSNGVAVSEEMRAAVIEKEVEEIQQLQDQADGSNNLVVITAIIAKLFSPEAEVHQAALDALRQLNDTNAIPGLQQAAQAMTNPREKVAVLDTIDYLKLPSITENVPPDLTTNPDFGKPRSTNRTSQSVHPWQRAPRQSNSGQEPDASGAAAGQQQ
jgi:hypothetical protein